MSYEAPYIPDTPPREELDAWRKDWSQPLKESDLYQREWERLQEWALKKGLKKE